MKDYIEERAMEIGEYIIDKRATVRQTAKRFGVSKSTVHKDVTERLQQINPSLAAEARKILDLNKSERHIRGGLATREKYLHMAHEEEGQGDGSLSGTTRTYEPSPVSVPGGYREGCLTNTYSFSEDSSSTKR